MGQLDDDEKDEDYWKKRADTAESYDSITTRIPRFVKVRKNAWWISLVILATLMLAGLAATEARFMIWESYGYPISDMGMNCGETRFRIDADIDDKNDLIDFLKKNWMIIHEKDWFFLPDNYRSDVQNYSWAMLDEDEKPPVNWTKLYQAIHVKKNWSLLFPETIFYFDYTPSLMDCGDGTFMISSSGMIVIKGCCGI